MVSLGTEGQPHGREHTELFHDFCRNTSQFQRGHASEVVDHQHPFAMPTNVEIISVRIAPIEQLHQHSIDQLGNLRNLHPLAPALIMNPHA